MGWEVDPRVEATLGLAGTVAAVLLFVAPWKTYQRIITNRSTEEFSPFPYTSMLLNCTVWVFYCLPSITPNRTSPLVTNTIGIVFQVGYLAVFVRYARDKAQAQVRGQLVALLLFLCLFVGGVMTALPDAPSRSFVIGLFATVFTVIMFASPLSSLAVVLKTRSVEFMPLALSLMGFTCSSVWTVYGIYVQDLFVIVPNSLGALLGVLQLAIYFHISRLSHAKGSYHTLTSADGPSSSSTAEGITSEQLFLVQPFFFHSKYTALVEWWTHPPV